jgi:hypothetical protein
MATWMIRTARSNIRKSYFPGASGLEAAGLPTWNAFVMGARRHDGLTLSAQEPEGGAMIEDVIVFLGFIVVIGLLIYWLWKLDWGSSL